MRPARLAGLALAALAVMGPAPAGAAIGSAPDEAFVTDGRVNAIARSADRIYLGGDFTRVGPRTGPWVVLSRSSGQTDATMPEVSGVDHEGVSATVPDGQGGFYIGGEFSHVGGLPRQNLAHIRADGSVDPDWAPSTNGPVYALDLAGGSVYIGGAFSGANALNGTLTRNHAAAVDATTGTATGWDPNIDGDIRTIAVSGLTVYLGGSFTSVNGNVAHVFAASVDALTGTVNAWDPNVNGGSVLDLAVSGQTVYFVGGFTQINGGTTRNHAAAVDATTALDTGWNPNIDNPANDLLVSGQTVYIGGAFNTVNAGTTRNGAAAVDATTGGATGWDPNVGGGVVDAIAASGQTVYLGGSFDTLNGSVPRSRLAATDATTGAVTAWDPDANERVRALAVSGSRLSVGGAFASIGGQVRNNAAALDAADGSLTAWNPNANDSVQALAVSGSTVYMGGSFTEVNNGTDRKRAAAVDATTGTANGWDPELDGTVNVFAVAGSTVYMGGSFGDVNDGAERNNAAAVDATTGLLTTWNADLNNTVDALIVSGDTVYLGGSFDLANAITPREKLAAVDATTGDLRNWDPQADADIDALAVSGQTVYAGGEFEHVNNGTARNHLAALDATTGVATAWNPAPDDYVHALAVKGSTVYAGGEFVDVNNGTVRNGVAALDASTGIANAFDPDAEADNPVRALALDDAGGLVVGGEFGRIGLLSQRGIASFSEPPASTDAPVVSGTPAVGETLTCSVGIWGGTMPQSYAFRWLRDGAEIGGATAANYTLVADDNHHAASCRVTARNLGTSTSATSAALDVPPRFQLSVSKTGSGSVTSNPAGIDCGAACAASFDSGTSVTLTAAPASGSKFDGFGGDCSGTAPCTVAMSAARSVTATFSEIVIPPPPPVAITKAATLKNKTYAANAKGVVTLPIGNPNAIDAQGDVTLKVKKKQIGRKRFTVKRNGTTRVKVKLNKKGRALVPKRKRQVKARIVLSANDTSKPVTRTISIRRRP